MKTPTKAIREKCLECCSGNRKYVGYCTLDGLNSQPACPLWPHRFGMRPKSAAKRYGPQFLDPKRMPGPNEPLDKLPPLTWVPISIASKGAIPEQLRHPVAVEDTDNERRAAFGKGPESSVRSD